MLKTLDGGNLPYASFGDSDVLAVGQLVIAVGNPFGFQSTVSTEGIFSAVGRTFRSQDGDRWKISFSHTAPMNPGNSGGPLVNTQGYIIGLNTAIIVMAHGIGFAIPANACSLGSASVDRVCPVRREYLGISGQV